MNKIMKITINSKTVLCHGALHKSKFILKDDFISYLEYTDNPNDTMFVADFYEEYSYKVESKSFKSNFSDICKEILKLSTQNYLSGDNCDKYIVKIYFEDKTTKSFAFYDTLEVDELKELARLIKCTIPPCECYPNWLEINELYLDDETLKYIEKIKNKEI